MRAGEAWVAGVRQLGGDGSIASSSAAALERGYAEAHRRYHGTSHVEAILRDGAWLAGELDLDADERAVLMLAACAHDVVYDAKPGEDERASAEWARAALVAAGVAGAAVRRVEHLVLLTVTHSGGADDSVAAALLDADLAILGADPAAYAGYVVAIRDEYVSVPDHLWREGRGRMLRDLLAREPLFRTEPGRRRWEDRARRNVRAELHGLGR